MRARRENSIERLEVRALYSVTELARAARVSTAKLRRVLRANHVVLLRSGRALFVPLSEIKDKIAPLWDGIVAAERLRRSLQ